MKWRQIRNSVPYERAPLAKNKQARQIEKETPAHRRAAVAGALAVISDVKRHQRKEDLLISIALLCVLGASSPSAIGAASGKPGGRSGR